MPKIVACPKCQKKYQLPDTFKAKRVRCRQCSTEFSTQPAGKPAPKPPAKPQAKPDASRRDALSSMGLSELKREEDLFGSEAHAGPDPLRNHVVQDPGFSLDPPPTDAATPAANPNADMGDVVSNPFMSAGGGTNTSAARSRALKRKKEDQLLATYQTNDTDTGGGPQRSVANDGVNRLTYWLAISIYTTVIRVVSGVTELAQDPRGRTADGEPSTEVAILTLFGILAFLVISGCFFAMMVNMRYENMKLKSEIWKKIATMTVVVTFGCFCLMLLVALLLQFVKAGFLLIIAIILLVVGAISGVATVPFLWGGYIFPPDFGKTRKLDFWSWFWIVVLALPVLLLSGVIVFVTFKAITG